MLLEHFVVAAAMAGGISFFYCCRYAEADAVVCCGGCDLHASNKIWRRILMPMFEGTKTPMRRILSVSLWIYLLLWVVAVGVLPLCSSDCYLCCWQGQAKPYLLYYHSLRGHVLWMELKLGVENFPQKNWIFHRGRSVDKCSCCAFFLCLFFKLSAFCQTTASIRMSHPVFMKPLEFYYFKLLFY